MHYQKQPLPTFHRRKAAEPEVIDFSKMDMIRPEGTARHNCLACAGETARILQLPQDAKVEIIEDRKNENDILGPNWLQKSTQFTAPASADEDPNRQAVKEFLAFFLAQKPGSIFFVNNEDHAFVIFKSYNQNLFLLDSDSHYYRQIKTDDDLYTKPGDVIERAYHFFYDNDGGLVTVVPLEKPAHRSWKNNVGPEKESALRGKTWFDDTPEFIKPPNLPKHVVLFHRRKPIHAPPSEPDSKLTSENTSVTKSKTHTSGS